MAPAIHRVTVVGFHGTLLFVEHLKRGEENLHFMVEETHTVLKVEETHTLRLRKLTLYG